MSFIMDFAGTLVISFAHQACNLELVLFSLALKNTFRNGKSIYALLGTTKLLYTITSQSVNTFMACCLLLFAVNDFFRIY